MTTTYNIRLASLIIIVMVTGYMWLLQPDENSMVLRLLQNMGRLGVLFVAVNFYSELQIKEREFYRNRSRDTVKVVDILWERIEKLFDDHYPNGVELWNETHPDSDPLPPSSNQDIARRRWTELRISRAIFQACENYLTLGGIDSTSKSCWLRIFTQMFRSPTLRRIWASERLSFSEDAQRFVDDIIEAARLIPRKGTAAQSDYDRIVGDFEVPLRHQA
jgi:hypothetical protein